MKPHPLALLALTACVAEPGNQQTTADTTIHAPIITVTSVNNGTHGMRTQVRWVFSPDRKAVLVVADPVSSEGDALPNGFFFGDETRAFQTQVDSVWDVAVSPDWKMIGFGRAYTVLHGEPPATDSYAEVARRTSIDAATLRAASFPTSGMVTHFSVAQPGVIRIPDDPRQAGFADSAAPRLFPVARGWRVRWTEDGGILALGNNPSGVGDDEPSKTWAALDPRTGALHTSLPASAKLSEPTFIEGPEYELSSPVDVTTRPAIKLERGGKSYTIESQRGVITLVETGTGPNAPRVQTVIGAGVALAATAEGKYVIALAPRTRTNAGEMAVEPVVYTVTR